MFTTNGWVHGILYDCRTRIAEDVRFLSCVCFMLLVSYLIVDGVQVIRYWAAGYIGVAFALAGLCFLLSGTIRRIAQMIRIPGYIMGGGSIDGMAIYLLGLS
jgi:hypothetical protein